MEFVRKYGNLYLIPKRLNQELVESFFFSLASALWWKQEHDSICVCSQYHGILSYKSANLVSRSQTNINSMQDLEVTADLNALAADTLPRRAKSSSVNDQVDWDVFI